jgi:hypothetical protein
VHDYSFPRYPRRSANGQGAVLRSVSVLERWLSRDFISLPLLKKGTALLATKTKAPVRGFRPVLPSRNFMKNTPNPRSSTRSPRAIAAVISEKMALTIFSASCRYRCGFRTDIRSMSSDLITAEPSREFEDVQDGRARQAYFHCVLMQQVSWQRRHRAAGAEV